MRKKSALMKRIDSNMTSTRTAMVAKMAAAVTTPSFAILFAAARIFGLTLRKRKILVPCRSKSGKSVKQRKLMRKPNIRSRLKKGNPAQSMHQLLNGREDSKRREKSLKSTCEM